MNFLTAACVLVASSAVAANILSPSDTIFGVILDGGQIQVGTVGTVPATNNWPAAEPPTDLINLQIGGAGEKYLNFFELNTGVVVTPAAGLSLATGIILYTANDAADRDPTSFSIWGTNVVSSLDFADYTPIVQNMPILETDPGRNSSLNTTNFNSGLVSFANAVPYSTYLIIFPTVRNETNANSMQVSELHLEGTVVPEPGAALLLLGGAAIASVRRRRAAVEAAG